MAIRLFRCFSMSGRGGQPIAAADFPAGEKVVKLRTRYYDDRLDEQLSRGCRQVVILGAGLDTRAVRKQSPGATYFDIDNADTVSFKQARLAEAGVEAPIVFIPGNYITDGLLRLLAANGFDFDMPTYVIWEGNTMYLSRPSILEVLTDLRRRVSHFCHLLRLYDRGGDCAAMSEWPPSLGASRPWARHGKLASTISKHSPVKQA
jgi:methyltransferase (TIGR00027 family)